MEAQRTDAMLMEILRDRQTVTGFLDAIFAFLRRNTDFYHIKKDNAEQIGFPKGIREQILFSAMQRYDPHSHKNVLATEDADCAPPAVEEIEVETELSTRNARVGTAHTGPLACIKVKEDIFTPADYKNGALHSNYCWSQTLHDVDVHVKLPEDLSGAKQLLIEITAHSLTVKSRTQPQRVLLTGQLSNKFKHNDAVWTIAERKLHINFDKAKEGWWEKLFDRENTIDIKSIDCERYIDELPEESQAAIQRLRVQQIEEDTKNRCQIANTKAETMEKLRKAWNADGSPFKGQPFDPSVVKFS